MDHTPRLTVEEYEQLRKEGPGKGAGKRHGREHKYHAVRTHGYASTKEYNRALRLQLLQKAGVIADLREQVSFTLIPSQRDDDGKVIERPCSYIADFVYTDCATGKTVVEDVKGVRTPEYVIKRKLMLFIHGIRIQEY